MASYLDDLVSEEVFPKSDLDKVKRDWGKFATGMIIGGVTGSLAFGIDYVAGTGAMSYISGLAHSVADAAGYAAIGLGAYHPFLQAIAAGAGIAGGFKYPGASVALAGVAAVPAVIDAGAVAAYYGWYAAAGALTGSLLGILGIYGVFWGASRLLRKIFKRSKKKK